MDQFRAEAFEAEPTRQVAARTAVVVLGMHRSGTSALAGVLSILGCDQPATLMVPNQNNEKGYFESSKLYQLHTQLFASAASSWDDWLPMPRSWLDSPRAAEFHDRALALMGGEFGASRLFILKDPRICRLVPFWEGVLADFDAAPAYVLTHRNPLEVAASLNKRDGMAIGFGLLVWLRHVLEAESGTRGRARCFTNFGQLMTNWAGVAERIQQTLNLSLPRFSLGSASEVESFLLGELRHHREAPEKVLQNPMLSVWVRDTYEILERWAAGGEDNVDFKRLDAIRAALDSAAPAFAQILKFGREDLLRLGSEKASLVEELGTVREEASAMSARMNELRVAGAWRENKLKTLTGDLEAARARDEGTSAELAEVTARLERTAGELSARDSAHAEILAGRDREIARLQEVHNALAGELKVTRGQLAQEQSALAQRRLEVEETRKALDELQDQTQERAAAQAELSALLAEKEAALDRERKSAESRFGQLDTRLQTQFRELADVTRFLFESEQALTSARIQLDAERARAAQLEQTFQDEIVALRTSTSWRITQPLRTVVDWIRGIRAKSPRRRVTSG